MTIFLKATGGVLIGLIMHLLLIKQGKDFSLFVTICACILLTIAASEFIKPIFDFFDKLCILGNLDRDILSVLVKSVGIGVISEITSLLCTDAGNAALGKTLQLLAVIIILYLSLPLFSVLTELIENLIATI